jgi:hypothetical protein
MRALIAAIASSAASVAFQLSVLIWPELFQRYAWSVKYLWIIAGILWLSWILSHPKFRRLLAAGQDSRPTNGPANQNLNVSVNPVFSPVFSQQMTDHSTPGQPKPVPGTGPEPGPNIRFVRTKTIWVTQGGDHGRALVEATREIDSHNPRALVACFRNTPSEASAVPDAHNVQGHIIYTDLAGNEVDDIAKAYWLEPYAESAALTLGATRCVILMLRTHDGKLLVPNQDWRKEFDAGQVSTIEVRLIHNNIVVLSESFGFKDNNGTMEVSRLSPTLRLTHDSPSSIVTAAGVTTDKASALLIKWNPNHEVYVHRYELPKGNWHVQYRICIENTTGLSLTNVNVKLARLTPRTLDCVPCDLKLMNDNPGPDGPYIKTLSLGPRAEQFIDLLLQWPNGNEFWILHTVPRQPKNIPAQAYSFIVKATAAEVEPAETSFQLIKNGPEWLLQATD